MSAKRVHSPAKSIAEQVREALVREEEERCQRIEAAREADSDKKGKSVKRRKIPVPRVRSGPRALCQDPDLLRHVSEFDFDLRDESFRRYCAARGVLHVAGFENSTRWTYFRDHSLTEIDFLRREAILNSSEPGKSEYRFSRDELLAQWRGIRMGRAILQDCWELFQAERNAT